MNRPLARGSGILAEWEEVDGSRTKRGEVSATIRRFVVLSFRASRVCVCVCSRLVIFKKSLRNGAPALYFPSETEKQDGIAQEERKKGRKKSLVPREIQITILPLLGNFCRSRPRGKLAWRAEEAVGRERSRFYLFHLVFLIDTGSISER